MQYIPGPEEILAPAMQKLMEGINHAIDPDYKMREAVKAQLAINPELLQGLADAEAKTPGTMEQLGLGKLGGTIGAISPSIRAANEIKNREKEIELKASETASQTAISKLKGGLAVAGSETLETDPNARKEAGSIAATGMPTWERATGEQKASYQATVKRMIKDGPQVTLQKFKSGEYTNEEMAAIFDSPLGKGLQMQAELEMDRTRRAMATAQLRADSAMERLMAAQAFQLYQSTNTSNPNAFLEILSDPTATERARALSGKDPKTLTPAEKELVDAYTGIQLLGQKDRIKVEMDVNKELLASVAGFRSIKQGSTGEHNERSLAATAINQALQHRTDLLGLPKFTVEYQKKVATPWAIDKPGLIYKDSRGVVVSEQSALNAIPGGPTFKEQVGHVMTEIQQVRNDPVKLQLALEELKAADANGLVYNAVREAIKGKNP